MQGLDLRRINIEEWIQSCKKLILQHGTRSYVLTSTRRGKLILTTAESSSKATTTKPIVTGKL